MILLISGGATRSNSMSQLLENTWQDFAYALRLFRLNKGFFAVATLSLALGIGANTAIFQLLDAVRLRSLPLQHPEQLAELKIADKTHCCSGNFSNRYSNFTYAQWDQIRQHQQAFSDVTAWGDRRFDLSEGGEVHYAEGLWISGDFFRTLGVQPLLGRLLGPEDDHPACGSPSAVISYSFWQRTFAGDPGVIGKTVTLDAHRLPIVGVTPPAFFGVEVGRQFDVAAPVCAEPLIGGENSHLAKRNHWWLAILGRLKPGWTLARAEAQLQSISPTVFGNTVPPMYRPDTAKNYTLFKLGATPAGTGFSDLRKDYEQPLWLLLGIAALVLLIACSNLANLLLARATAREREIAVRLAVGADRSRLIRQLLTESFLLTIIGTALGAWLAQFLSRFLVAFLTTGSNPLFVELAPDWRLLAFTAAVAILTCVLFGLTPAIRATQTPPAAAMKTAGRGIAGTRERFGLRRALVVSQVALSLVLLVGALLFVRSLRNLVTLDAGFNETGLIITSLDISRLNTPKAARLELFRKLLEDIRNTPGVTRATTSVIIPISGDGWNSSIEILGHHSDERRSPWFNRVSAGYFQTMETGFLAGRDFDAHDTLSSTPVAIVNQEFAAKFLHGVSPLGKQVRVLTGPGEPQQMYQVVGVVKNSKYRALRDDFKPIIFLPDSQDSDPGLNINLITRSNIPLGPLTAAIKKTVLKQNGNISLQFQSFPAQIRESLLRERLMATLSAFFGLLAAVLAAVGLYGVIAYMVERRRNEIGIRIALGANRRTVVGLVVKEAILLLAVGAVVGTALALAGARAAATLLYGLKPGDPASIALAVLGLAIVALFATFVPALRASQVEPIQALREE